MLQRGRQALILDLRDNGGGLLEEAVSDREHLHPGGHDRLDRRPRACPRQVYLANGDAIPTIDPDGGARQPRHRLGGRDRHRRAEGSRAREGRRHAHVRQGRLPGDPAAAQRRRAGLHRRRVLHPERDTTSARGGVNGRNVNRGPGIKPRSTSPSSPTRRRHAAARSPRRPSSPSCSDARPPITGAPVSDRGGEPRRRRGSRSSRARASSWSPSRSSRPARGWRSAATSASTSATWSSWSGAAAGGRGRGRQGGSRRPRVRAAARATRRRPRRDRGADARPRAATRVRPGGASARPRASRPSVTVAGRRAGATCASCRRSRSTRSTARDFDDAISAEALRRRRLAGLGAHRRRRRSTCRRARRSTARPTGARPASTCRGGRADAARSRCPTAPARWCPAT